MIFSKFFKAKWQNKDANVRLSAIANDLSIDNQEHLDILVSLAKQDANDNVRKAALLKLNDLALYLDVYNNNDTQQSFAQKQIEKALLETNQQVAIPTKQQLTASLPRTFLETWLISESEIEITKGLYNKIAKPHLAVTLFTKKQDSEFQLFLLENIQDINLLEKLSKKTTVENVAATINSRITAITDAKEKPIQLAKSVQLSLSKLLALKDATVNYSELLTKRAVLETEWQQALNDFSILDKEQQDIFTTKYESISSQLDKIFAPKAELYKQEQIAKELTAAKNKAKEALASQINGLEQTLANAVFEDIDLSGSAFEAELNNLPDVISNSVLNTNEKSDFSNQVMQLQKKLKQLPAIAQSVTDATHLISKISQLPLPTSIEDANEKSVQFSDWKAQWKNVEKQSIGALPDSIKVAKEEIVKQWNTGLAPYFSEQKEILNQARKNIADLKRLIANGKFNPCFGIYKKLTKHYALLSDNQQQRVQRDFEALTEKMDDLADWEHYIATPRKQELLDHIKALVETPLDNPNEQAKKVKAYRKQWNSLGHADDEVEKTLNDEFNQACEIAFAPCRQFYAEQEKIREQHAQTRKNIITEVEALASTLNEKAEDEVIDFKAIDGKLNKLNKSWREAGDVDREQYQALQKQYHHALAPLKQAINNFQSTNATLKESLVNKAKAFLVLDDVFKAINEIKQLQSQWREIGYAGPKLENSLWQAFRTINDEVFAKREQVKQEQNTAQAQVKASFEEKLTTLKQEVSQSDSMTAFNISLENAKALLQEVISQKPVIKSVATQVDKIINGLNDSVKSLQNNKVKQDWQSVFALITSIADGESAETLLGSSNYTALPSFWQKKINDVLNQKEIGDRLSKTLELEILGGIESPAEFSSERLTVQVTLMQQQMLSGGNVDLQVLFIDWLKVGKLTSSDTPLINRIAPLYC